MIKRRLFVKRVALGSAALVNGRALGSGPGSALPRPSTEPPEPGEGLSTYIERLYGAFDPQVYARLLGAANEFKEGDEIVGVAAASVRSRAHARTLLANTALSEIDHRAPHQDQLYRYIAVDRRAPDGLLPESLGQLRSFLLAEDEEAIKALMPFLSSDVIGCVVKLMSNDELTALGAKVFNPLPGSNIGAKGYLGARVQPNSPTDNPDDIRWQVFDAFAYGVGDVLLGTNPVSSTVESVTQVELCLQDILKTFELTDVMPHCVLSHIDVQAEVERLHPGSTELWFQSIAGTDGANATFDLSIASMRSHAEARSGRFGLYFETGQGADFTNGHGYGFDMVLHEARKYGFARALSKVVGRSSPREEAWVHLNDVAGFIGPEVFRSREQLVRCCLEDIVMGKLHGLCIGLDVCSTLHMDVSLDDLDWCLNEIAPANPAYLMALPTKIDPMLGYLTTAYQDHVRLRQKFKFRINDPMWKFYEEIGVFDAQGHATQHFGDPTWIYLQYCRLRNDDRSDEDILREARQKITEVRGRGLFIAEGCGAEPHHLAPALAAEVQRIYEDGKQSIWAELTPEFIATVPDRFLITTQAKDRADYILHPETGERLTPAAQKELQALNAQQGNPADVQIVISDGLNAHSIMDAGHLLPFLDRLRAELASINLRASDVNLLVKSGRVRTGYRIGESLFAHAPQARTILHIIGERPGTGHHTFSVYITTATGAFWAEADKVDHNITRVVSGIANTALAPPQGASETVRILRQMVRRLNAESGELASPLPEVTTAALARLLP